MHFANLANFIALKGGKLKAEQSISGDMADILSNLYLGHSVRWYEEENNISKELTEYCIERLCRENQEKMNKIIENEGYLKYLLFFSRKVKKIEKYSDNKKMIEEISTNPKIINEIKQDVYTKDTILEDLIELDDLKQDSEKYNSLYNKIIQVGEYPN